MAGPVRIVIIDDAPRTLDNLKKLLAFETDVEVAGTALSAQQGFEEARRLLPDLILMDVNLPDLDGIQATEILTAELPHIPIVIVSVQDDKEYLRRAMQAGAREYLVKPFSADELMGAIHRVSHIESRKREVAAAAAAPPPPAPPAPSIEDTVPPQHLAPGASVTTQLSRADIAAALAARAADAPPAPPPAAAPAPPGPPVAVATPAPPALPPAVVPPPPAPASAPPPHLQAPPPARAEPLPATEPPPAPKAPRKHTNGVVTLLFSGKGGVGKSVLAINLAAALSKETNEEVALVDLNLQFGDLEVLLGLDSPGTIVDVARAFPNVDAPMIGSLMPETAGKVRVLAGPRSPELADLIHAEHVRAVLEILRQAFEHVVVDCQTHLDDRTLEAVEASDNIVLITDLNIPSIKDAKLAFKLFESLHVSRERIFLVLNRSTAPSNVTVAQLEANLRCPVSVQIPSEGKLVLASIQKAAPFVLMFPDAQISHKVREVVGLLIPLARAAGDSGAKGARRRLFGAR